MNNNKFSSLNIPKELVKNLDDMCYFEMTPIQMQSLPHILDKKDVIAQAKTGSGKTAAFGIGVVVNVDTKEFKPSSLVLCPTRELADQVAKELRTLARYKSNTKIITLYGGVSFGMQLGSLKHGANIVVATTTRVLKHLRKESLDLSKLDILVLDEADRMLDMGFLEEIEEILKYIPKNRQTLMFSATFSDEILQLSKSFQRDAVHIKSVEEPNKIKELFFKAAKENKVDVLIDILATYVPQSAIVFVNTKVEADILASRLQERDIDALAIHGDLEQFERNDVLVQFSNKSCPILIATDVAARGLDIKELPLVINYDAANTKETYTHRIGRTGRRDMEGLAITLCSDGELEKMAEFKGKTVAFEDSSGLKCPPNFKLQPKFMTLVIEGGKKDRLRAGDILGALTADIGLQKDDVGKIDIYDRQSYVAINISKIDEVYEKLKKSAIKAKKFSVWIL